MRKRWLANGLLIITAILIIAGCTQDSTNESVPPNTSNNPTNQGQSNQNVDPPPPVEKHDPVTVTMGAHISFLTDEELNRYVVEPVKRKYPYITVERTNEMPKGTMTVEDMVIQNEIPDIIIDAPYALMKIIGMGVTMNIEDLIKKHQFDTGRLLPELIESLKTATGLDHMISLPYYNLAFAVFYNNDLFDRFGVDPPKDGMSWEQIRNIGVAMTREENGTPYYGLWPGDAMWGGYQMGLPYLDSTQSKTLLNTAEWQDVLSLWASLIKSQGSLLPPQRVNYDQLFYEGQVAISWGHMGTLQHLRENEPFDWNLISYPENPKAPGYGQRADTYNLVITKQSKNPDAAFKVLEVVLSDEVQLDWSRNGKMSVLKKQSIHDEFGKAITEFADKNVVALTKAKLQVIQPFVYDYKTLPVIRINTALNEVVWGGKDINTALREADELFNIDTQEFLK